jgi:hypothetical protein
MQQTDENFVLTLPNGFVLLLCCKFQINHPEKFFNALLSSPLFFLHQMHIGHAKKKPNQAVGTIYFEKCNVGLGLEPKN